MSYEVVLPQNAFTEKVLRIDENTIAYHDIEMECKDVTAFGFAPEKVYLRGMHVGTVYKILIQDSSGDELSIDFSGGSVFDPEERAVIFLAIIDHIWNYFGHRLLNESIAAISSGEGWDLGGITCDREGVHFVQRGWFGKKTERCIQWNHIRHNEENGWLNFKSAIDSDVYFKVGMISYDVPLLSALFTECQRQPLVMDYVTGKKILQL